MFSIVKYEHEFLEKESQRLKIFFKYNSPKKRKVRVKIYEGATNARWQVILGEITVQKDVIYWVEDIHKFKFECMYNNDVIVKFVECDTNDVLWEKKINTSKVNISKRSLGGDFSKKNTWIIGDSHINHFFSYGVDYNVKNFETNNTIINPLALPLLSINRFVNSDYSKIIKNLPVMGRDDICLFFGEIDTRIGIIRNSRKKNISLYQHTINLVDRFTSAIEVLKKQYTDCNFYYILPNAPVEDMWISDEKKIEVFDFGNQHERYVVRYMFEDIVKSKMGDINVKTLDIYKSYIKSDMFVDEKFLIENDHHFKTPNTFLEKIKEIF